MPLSKEEIITRLNEDLALEHAAIIQYLGHVFRFREGQVPREIEEISRDEMRHFKWLFEKIVDLGGKPTLDRAPVLRGEDPREMLENDVLAEDLAIEGYKQHIEEIDDPNIVALLERILLDEEHHRDEFVEMAEEADEMGALPEGPKRQIEEPEKAAALLNEDIEVEYTTVLRYLNQAYAAHPKVGWELEARSQEEMKHMEFLGELIVDIGAEPRLEHAEVDEPDDDLEVLLRESKREETTHDRYHNHFVQIEDEKIREVLKRIMAEEKYHELVFSQMASDLLGNEDDVREEAAVADGGNTEAQVPEMPQQTTAAEPSETGYTIGSLFGSPQP